MNQRFDAVVIGGGFYGCALATHLKEELDLAVLLVEAEADLLQKASYANQARVHHGYHYPRSLLTGARSKANYERFLTDFSDCIDDEFDQYYAIGRHFSRVNAAQFQLFCDRIGTPLQPAESAVKGLFNPLLIEDVFKVQEVVFDAVRLKRRVVVLLQEAGVEQRLLTSATHVERCNGGVRVELRHTGGNSAVESALVFNCTYSRINKLLSVSGLPLIDLKHEWAEMCLVRPPEPLATAGVTVMCGPFFSIMPFPPRGLHSFSHVRYTPHCEWRDTPGDHFEDPEAVVARVSTSSHFQHMLKDASRYVPCMSGCSYVDSLWGVKTVLPENEGDDGRPILFKSDHGIAGLTCIMGSKIDNVYDVMDFATAVARKGLSSS